MDPSKKVVVGVDYRAVMPHIERVFDELFPGNKTSDVREFARHLICTYLGYGDSGLRKELLDVFYDRVDYIEGYYEEVFTYLVEELECASKLVFPNLLALQQEVPEPVAWADGILFVEVNPHVALIASRKPPVR